MFVKVNVCEGWSLLKHKTPISICFFFYFDFGSLWKDGSGVMLVYSCSQSKKKKLFPILYLPVCFVLILPMVVPHVCHSMYVVYSLLLENTKSMQPGNIFFFSTKKPFCSLICRCWHWLGAHSCCKQPEIWVNVCAGYWFKTPQP